MLRVSGIGGFLFSSLYPPIAVATAKVAITTTTAISLLVLRLASTIGIEPDDGGAEAAASRPEPVSLLKRRNSSRGQRQSGIAFHGLSPGPCQSPLRVLSEG